MDDLLPLLLAAQLRLNTVLTVSSATHPAEETFCTIRDLLNMMRVTRALPVMTANRIIMQCKLSMGDILTRSRTKLAAAASDMSEWSYWVMFLTEGVLILVVGVVGLFGNAFSAMLFARQRVQRVFHRLLMLLVFFDAVSHLSYSIPLACTHTNTMLLCCACQRRRHQHLKFGI